ncbi:Uncharacterised protein [Legionella wadsworthii]|uniref:Uncharacterized protein n=1 Tax=Legionella wadsworthii TaxID=28088 RepID=A0A378LVX2_9GAMM|nr:hypothetical protein [Legionella wadsworthii]STY31041.1 Uncharacterised protein [Legionella wadsworthii]
MRKRIVCFLLCTFLLAEKINADIPKDLMFHNEPIDALCFFNFEGKDLDLQHCGLAKEKYLVKGHDSSLLAKGYIGFNWQDPLFPDSAQGYSYYKFFSAGENQYWLYTLNSGGGTGNFTAIHQVKRKNENTLEIKTLTGGDRCNGGLQDVTQYQDQLRFSQNLTAYDLLALASTSEPTVKAYDDLAACAICCVADAFYELDANAQLKLRYVDLGNIKDAKELPEQGALQPCFNQLLTSYIQAGKTKLTQDILHEFALKFEKTCKESK